MRAEMDLIGAISACPQDLYPANGYRITDLEVIVGDTNEHTGHRRAAGLAGAAAGPVTGCRE